ncbi:hypothetical protein O181_071402 [Austropuccinia psidii MF-1]|uniref:Uncharacterized protein n=1 Tax=Austropuccinia psidii MF-1 TaxID=1389203 RepID=A0A9Q3I954_9BASI|nr:hypothetical protein [Austropuccinia psidii MF-1]
MDKHQSDLCSSAYSSDSSYVPQPSWCVYHRHSFGFLKRIALCGTYSDTGMSRRQEEQPEDMAIEPSAPSFCKTCPLGDRASP